MIDAKELRLNNLFIGFDDKVFQWSLAHFTLLYDEIDITEIIKSPIKITEELLLMFGFKKRLGDFFELDDFGCMIIDDGVAILYCGHQLGTFKYLHELQNLKYELSRNELLLKVP